MARLRPRDPAARSRAIAESARRLAEAVDRLGHVEGPKPPGVCASGKVTYDDPATAWKLVRAIPRQRAGANLRAYRCDLCTGWHLTGMSFGPAGRG